MVEDGAFSHKIDYGIYFKEILNLEAHPNCITGSTVMELRSYSVIFCENIFINALLP